MIIREGPGRTPISISISISSIISISTTTSISSSISSCTSISSSISSCTSISISISISISVREDLGGLPQSGRPRVDLLELLLLPTR